MRIVLLTVAITGAIVATLGCQSNSAAVPTCVAAPDETCPSDTMVRDWQEFKVIQDRYKMSREDELKASGLMAEMQKEAAKYPGTNWDDKKLRFVKVKAIIPPSGPSQAQLPEKK